MAEQGQFAKAVGANLRTVREQRRWSLRQVEAESGGRWKAVVLGSWERGDRGMLVEHLDELARFYDVPLLSLLPPEQVPQQRAA